MLVARDAHGQLLTAETFRHLKKTQCYCPGCKGEVVFKCGSQKIPHFAHRRNQECQHFTEGETAEHLSGKQLLLKALPKDTQLEAYLPRLAQRPDLLWRSMAVEFQCSSLSRERFTERTLNYLAHGYTPWWLVGRQFFPQHHWRQVTSCCLHEGGKGPILWGLDVEKQRLLLFHSFDWHYQLGLSFAIRSCKLENQCLSSLFFFIPEKKLVTSWSVRAYQRRVQEKLARKEKGILDLQAQCYLFGMNIAALPAWCYRSGSYQALLQEGLLFLRGLYGKGLRDFALWYEKGREVLDWPYPMLNQKRIFRELFNECALLEEKESEETRKF